LSPKRVAPVDVLEVLLAQVGRDRLDRRRGIDAVPADGERVVVDIRRVDLHAFAEPVHTQLLAEHDRERVGLLAAGRARRPDPDRVLRALALDKPRNDLGPEVLPGGRIPKERRHVDEDGVEELAELVGVLLEVVDVVGVRTDSHGFHASLDAAHQARALVPREVEAAAALDVVQQGLEVLVALRLGHAAASSSGGPSAPSSDSRTRRIVAACRSASAARSTKKRDVLLALRSSARSARRRVSAPRSSSARMALQSAASSAAACSTTRLSTL